MNNIELKEEIRADTSLRDYKLFDDACLVGWWERVPSPNDNTSTHTWHGEWTEVPKEKIDEYNLRYAKKKFCAKVVGTGNLKEELERAVNELASRFGKEV